MNDSSLVDIDDGSISNMFSGSALQEGSETNGMSSDIDISEDRELIEGWQSSVNGMRSGHFHSRFHDDYVGIIMLEMLDKRDLVNYRCIMTDAFPLQLSVVNLGYENSDITKFNAQFRYRYWTSEFVNSNQSNLITGYLDKYLTKKGVEVRGSCLLYTSPSPRDRG